MSKPLKVLANFVEHFGEPFRATFQDLSSRLGEVKMIDFMTILLDLAKIYPNTIEEPEVAAKSLRAMEFFTIIIDQAVASKMTPNLKDVHEVTYRLGLNINSFEGTKKKSRRKNRIIMFFEGLFILLVKQRGLFQQYMIKDMHHFCKKFPEFSVDSNSCVSIEGLSRNEQSKFKNGLNDPELEKLLNFYNVLVVISSMSEKPKLGKFVDLTACIAEGEGVEYVNGGGATGSTLRRKYIYLHVTKLTSSIVPSIMKSNSNFSKTDCLQKVSAPGGDVGESSFTCALKTKNKTAAVKKVRVKNGTFDEAPLNHSHDALNGIELNETASFKRERNDDVGVSAAAMLMLKAPRLTFRNHKPAGSTLLRIPTFPPAHSARMVIPVACLSLSTEFPFTPLQSDSISLQSESRDPLSLCDGGTEQSREGTLRRLHSWRPPMVRPPLIENASTAEAITGSDLNNRSLYL